MSKRTAQTINQEPDAAKQTKTAKTAPVPAESSQQLPQQVAEGPNPMQMLQSALERGMDTNTIEKLMDLRDRWERGNAEKAYHAAVAAFKANPPKVYRDMVNKQFDSTYSSLANLVNTVNEGLSPHGLSAHWEVVSQDKDGVTIACILSHIAGHNERVQLWAPIDTSGSKNPVQQVKSTATYLRGVTFEMVTGVATSVANLDDDAKAAAKEPEYIDDKQKSTIIDYLESTESDTGAFLEWLGVESIDMIPKDWYEKVINNLRRKAKKMESGE